MIDDSFLMNALTARKLPARINVETVAELLGFTCDDISIIAREDRLLKPLGAPAKNAPKLYATIDVLRLTVDANWLDKASARVRRHHSEKRKINARKRTEVPGVEVVE